MYSATVHPIGCCCSREPCSRREGTRRTAVGYPVRRGEYRNEIFPNAFHVLICSCLLQPYGTLLKGEETRTSMAAGSGAARLTSAVEEGLPHTIQLSTNNQSIRSTTVFEAPSWLGGVTVHGTRTTATHATKRKEASAGLLPCALCVGCGRVSREHLAHRARHTSGDQRGMMASARLHVWYQQQVSSRCSSTRHASRRSVWRGSRRAEERTSTSRAVARRTYEEYK